MTGCAHPNSLLQVQDRNGWSAHCLITLQKSNLYSMKCNYLIPWTFVRNTYVMYIEQKHLISSKTDANGLPLSGNGIPLRRKSQKHALFLSPIPFCLFLPTKPIHHKNYNLKILCHIPNLLCKRLRLWLDGRMWFEIGSSLPVRARWRGHLQTGRNQYSLDRLSTRIMAAD